MPYYKKYRVTIVGFDGALASVISGAMDIFSFAGVSWQRFNQLPPEQRFSVSLASLQQRPVECINRISLHAHEAIEDVKETDILLIPTIGGSIEKVLEKNQALLPHLIRLSQAGCDVASNCSGAFLLAKAGLLKNQNATTHWGYADLFKKMFPDVNLAINQMITQSDNIYCAGGGAAFHNLCLLLIERYCGRETAKQVAKAHVIDTQRSNQSAFANVRLLKQHQQPDLIKVQDYIEDNYQRPMSIADLADMVNISTRTLNRQFQKWVNMRPIEYIQTIRVEQAKRLLEAGHKHVQSLALEVGYDDAASFAKLFKKSTGYTPAQYKTKFHQDFDI
jgi:transcriptional regulator GlxA family with amidase domain